MKPLAQFFQYGLASVIIDISVENHIIRIAVRLPTNSGKIVHRKIIEHVGKICCLLEIFNIHQRVIKNCEAVLKAR